MHKLNGLSLSLHPISVARSSCVCSQPCAFKQVATAPEGNKKYKEIPGPSSSRPGEEEKLLPKLGTGKFPQCLLRTQHPNPPNWSEHIAANFPVILSSLQWFYLQGIYKPGTWQAARMTPLLWEESTCLGGCKLCHAVCCQGQGVV